MLTADAGLTNDASGKVTDWTSQVEPKVKFAQDNADTVAVTKYLQAKYKIAP